MTAAPREMGISNGGGGSRREDVWTFDPDLMLLRAKNSASFARGVTNICRARSGGSKLDENWNTDTYIRFLRRAWRAPDERTANLLRLFVFAQEGATASRLGNAIPFSPPFSLPPLRSRQVVCENSYFDIFIENRSHELTLRGVAKFEYDSSLH